MCAAINTCGAVGQPMRSRLVRCLTRVRRRTNVPIPPTCAAGAGSGCSSTYFALSGILVPGMVRYHVYSHHIIYTSKYIIYQVRISYLVPGIII